MSKRIGKVLLITAALLILVACLPGITGCCMDCMTHGKADTAPITQIELQMGDRAEIDPGRMFQRLALERNMQTIPVTSREATMTKDQVFSAVEEQIPNIDVQKVRNSDDDSDHFWSLVSIDGGEHYYHFDATPRSGSGDSFCLVTDAYLNAYSEKHKGSHNRDESLYPATPEETL